MQADMEPFLIVSMWMAYSLCALGVVLSTILWSKRLWGRRGHAARTPGSMGSPETRARRAPFSSLKAQCSSTGRHVDNVDSVSYQSASSIGDIEDLAQAGACAHRATFEPFGSHESQGPLFGAGLSVLHLEISTRCNASCPQCPRNVRGGRDNPRLPLVELRLADVQEIVHPNCKSLSRLRKVFLCGNYGDPTAARDCIAIVRYLLAIFPGVTVGVHTNGGARSVEWWHELGTLLRAPHYCRFAIDGLEDTNHLYRQGVRWDLLVRNVRAFVASGGHAQQDFLVFRHNEHQVEASRTLAADLGMSRFSVKRTRRFVDKETGHLHERTPVEDSRGHIVRYLEPPVDTALRNEADLVDLQLAIQRHGSLAAYHDAAHIACKAQHSAEAYISAEGLVFPCCFLAGELYNRRGGRQFLDLLASNELSLEHLRVTKERTLDDVLCGPLFAEHLTASWARPSVATGKLRTCSAVCGVEHCAFDKQLATPPARSAAAAAGSQRAIRVVKGRVVEPAPADQPTRVVMGQIVDAPEAERSSYGHQPSQAQVPRGKSGQSRMHIPIRIPRPAPLPRVVQLVFARSAGRRKRE